MRVAALCTSLAFAMPLTALAAPMTVKSTVQSGVKSKVSQHAAFGRTCSPQRVVVKITTQPANGSVTTAEEPSVMPAVTKLGGAQPCAGKTSQAAVVYYQSRPGFKGVDQIKYERTNLDNARDRLNGEVTLTITVK